MNQLQQKHYIKAIIMNNSTTFKLAHAMTKQVIKAGDNYQVTFGACLKLIKADQLVNAANLKADLMRAQYNSKGANNKGDKLSVLINNEFAKMIIRRNTAVKPVEVKKGLFSKLASYFKAA